MVIGLHDCPTLEDFFLEPQIYPPLQLLQIMHMSNMKDHERLALLKEIGGTGVYEERRRESLKVMAETETRRTQIEETVGWDLTDAVLNNLGNRVKRFEI